MLPLTTAYTLWAPIFKCAQNILPYPVDIGGTGHCPLTDYAGRYSQARTASIGAKHKADAIWQRIEPRLANMDLDMRSIITQFYNMAMPWEDIPASIKRSPKACERMHRDAIAYLELQK